MPEDDAPTVEEEQPKVRTPADVRAAMKTLMQHGIVDPDQARALLNAMQS